MLPATLEQARIGGMGNCLLHHRRIDDDPLQARCLDHVCASGRFDRLGQQLFNAGLAQALPPARQARRIDRRLRLQVRLAGEHLPIRVLQPLPDDILVRQVEGMLQIQQPTDKAWRCCRSAAGRHEARTHRRVQPIPVDQIGKPNQRMLQVDLLAQRLAEEISLWHRRLRTHPHLVRICRIHASICPLLASQTTPFRLHSLAAHASQDCSGRTI
jgi:hypothetical protein